MVPIGCMIAKKLNCDPILGGAFILIGCMVGGIFSPTGPMLAQLTMDVPVYSGFGMRMLLDIPAYLITMFWMWRYAKKVAADPTKSAMGIWHSSIQLTLVQPLKNTLTLITVLFNH